MTARLLALKSDSAVSATAHLATITETHAAAVRSPAASRRGWLYRLQVSVAFGTETDVDACRRTRTTRAAARPYRWAARQQSASRRPNAPAVAHRAPAGSSM